MFKVDEVDSTTRCYVFSCLCQIAACPPKCPVKDFCTLRSSSLALKVAMMMVTTMKSIHASKEKDMKGCKNNRKKLVNYSFMFANLKAL